MDVDLFQFGTADLYHAAVLDISLAGIRVKASDLRLERDRTILITLTGPELLRGPECLARARFVRSTGGGVALRFHYEDSQTRECVAAVLKSHGFNDFAPLGMGGAESDSELLPTTS
jgi:hypothetical protein